MDDSSLQALAAAWRDADRVVVLTGAGLSTASGIPDFRSPGGRWENYQPVTIQEFDHSHEARVDYWRYKGETWRTIAAARPNAGHVALAELASADRLDLLVTQNVDGLHRRSGVPPERLITIHGTDSMVECRGCGRRDDRAAAQGRWETGVEVPKCEHCGGPLKPATISFGQSLVMTDLQRAFDAADGCDLFVAVGTSLVVSPIHHIVSLAVRAGAAIAILTASETPFDAHADWRSNDPVEAILPQIRDLVFG